MINLKKLTLSDGGIHILLSALVDNKPISMVLDTGASHSVLDFSWAEENLPDNEIIAVEDPAYGIGSSVKVHKAEVSSFKIGDLNLKNRLFALIDFSAINSVYDREGLEEVQGILGGDVLDEFSGVIDYGSFVLKFIQMNKE